MHSFIINLKCTKGVRMKKILLIVFVLFSLSVYANSFFEPQWQEFCPSRYANVDSSKWYYTASGKYWAKRRKLFEERLAKCNGLSLELRDACYQSLREIETNATQMYANEKSSKALKYMMINSMF